MTADYNLKLADFGFATPTTGSSGSGYSTTSLGTRGYMAPEVIKNKPYKGANVDLFAAGIILFIMFTGVPPFAEAQDGDHYYKYFARNRADLFWNKRSQYLNGIVIPDEFKDLITRMVAYNPD